MLFSSSIFLDLEHVAMVSARRPGEGLRGGARIALPLESRLLPEGRREDTYLKAWLGTPGTSSGKEWRGATDEGRPVANEIRG